MVDVGCAFTIFVGGNGRMVVPCRPLLFNRYCEIFMVTIKIGTHDVEIYDSIDELPIIRFHKYQKLLLVDSGIGADINSFDQRIEKTRRFLMSGKPDQAQRELENLRQCVFLIQSGVNPQLLSFCALVKTIDGITYDDVSDDALRKVCDILSDVPIGEVTAQFEAVKKKIDGELMLYFPNLFADSRVKEYFDILKKRTLAVLNDIIAGKDPTTDAGIDRLTTELLTYSHPQSFSGPEGVEIQFDRQFENLCLVLSEQLHVKPKEYSVLEFYNAFDFVKERSKQAENARKRGKNQR